MLPNRVIKIQNWLKTDILLWVSLAFLHVSPAIASIGVIGFLIQLLIWGERKKPSTIEQLGWAMLLIGLCWNVSSILTSPMDWIPNEEYYGIFSSTAKTKAMLRLPLVFLSLFYLLGFRIKTVFYEVWPLIILPLIWISVSSAIHYFQHMAFFNQMVLESKPIPLYSGVYHIEYGVITAMVVLLLILGVLQKRLSGSGLLWLGLLVLVIGMQILGSRTGLLMLYVGLFLLGTMFGLKYKNKLKFFLGSMALFFGLIFLLPSARNRMVNTIRDLKITMEGKDVTHQSFGQRWMSWQAAVNVINNQNFSAVKGVGVATDFWLHKSYRNLSLPLADRHQVGVHNQWLETAVQSGWLSSLFIFFSGFTVFGFANNRQNKWGWILWLSLVMAMMFESLLERQAGVLVVVLMFQVMQGQKSDEIPEESMNTL